MYHAFFARCKFYESAKFLDAYYRTGKDLSSFEVCSDNADHIHGFCHFFFVCTANGNGTVIVDIDLYTCLLNNGVDNFALLSHYVADLLRINADLDDLRSIFVYGRSGFCNRFRHDFVHDIKSCFSCSGNSFFNDGTCQTMDLDIHLDSSDPFFRAGHLKVHISEEVLQTLDVCQYNVIVIGLSSYQTAGDARYHALNGHTRCHQGHGRCTDTCLGCGSVGFKGFGNRTDSIWEFCFAGKYRHQCTLCQCSVTDLTASRSSGRLCFTN